MKIFDGGVTAAKGFAAAGAEAGIKYKNRKDMPMTPVDATKTEFAGMPRASAVASAV